MGKKVLIFMLGSIATVAVLAVYGYRHIDDFVDVDVDSDDCDDDFEDKDIADEFDDDDDVACLGNCEECDLCSNGAVSVIPDVSGISAGYEA